VERYSRLYVVSIEALFQLMRFNILSTAVSAGEEWPIHPAYVYAWLSGVYPDCDPIVKWHEPFSGQFSVLQKEVSELIVLLDEAWTAKKPISFYDVEDALGIHGVARSSSNWQRWKLVSACRYLFLSESFDDEFWKTLLKNGDCPSEALGIARQMKISEIQLS